MKTAGNIWYFLSFTDDRLHLMIECLLGHVSPKLSQLGRQLTDRQLGNKLNSSFCFTNVRHVKSDLNELTDDHAFSLAELSLVRLRLIVAMVIPIVCKHVI